MSARLDFNNTFATKYLVRHYTFRRDKLCQSSTWLIPVAIEEF